MATVVETPDDSSLDGDSARRSGTLPRDDLGIGSSLAKAMRRAQLSGIVFVQLVLMVAALASSLAVPKATVVVVASILSATAFAVQLLRVPARVLVVVYYLALGFYYVAAVNSNEPLVGALIPLTAWTVILPIMLRAGVWPGLLSGLLTAMYATLIALAHPDWEPSVVGASLTANAILVVAGGLFMRFLRRTARTLESQKTAAVEEERRAARQHASREASAECARVIHDTMMNTFGALSRHGSFDIDPVEAQERCRRDLQRIHALQRATGTDQQVKISLDDLEHVGLPVRWAGIAKSELRRFQALLPIPVLDALYGCTSEAILNATKHSGADHVTIEVRYVDNLLRVEITDDGRGFDRDNVAERGIAESLIARAEAHGITVALKSAIGEGTTVRLSFPLTAPSQCAAAKAPAKAMLPFREFKREMAVAWAVNATVIGVALELLSPHGNSLPAYLILASLLLFAGLVRATRRRGRPARWLTALMLAAVPIANWCALASVDYGHDTPYLFQGVSLTVLPVLIHVSSRTFGPFLAAVGLLLASTLAIGMTVTGSLTETLLLEAPVFALLGAWYVFLRIFRSLATEIAQSHQGLEHAMRKAAAREAAAATQIQWNGLGLQAPLRLLQDIADGVISADDPETRRRCGDEEAFLRQISALPQAATPMRRWLVVALAQARRRQVRLELHVEDDQIDNAQDAESLGELILDCIARSPEESTVTITILRRGGRKHMLVVGGADSDLASLAREHDQDSLRVTIQTLPDQTLLEATLI